jgi:hypothetical protein
MAERRRESIGMFPFAVLLFCILTAMILAGFGWAMNIVEIFNSNFEPFTGELAVRLIGVVVFPIGVIMGYI